MSENQQSLQPVSFSAKTQSWKVEYKKTGWELDTEELRLLIHTTEEALLTRWQELEDVPAHHEERQQMEAASKDLLAIKIYKLGWPDPCQ
jgi:hypothetical protein